MAGPKSKTLALKISGLYTDPNTFSEVPAGITLALANNMVLDRDSILASRRGFPQYGVSPDGATLQRSIFDFKDTLIVHDENNDLVYDSAGDGSVWTLLPGTYAAPGGTSADRITSFQSNKNLYLATNAGMYKMTSASSTPVLAGVSAGLGGSGSTTGASGFMSTNTNVAYRIVWGYRDDNENLILGAPSDRIVVSNTSGGDRDVSLTFFIPADITTSYFYQIYRSAGSATVNDQPDDELQLVQEASPTSGEITAGSITFTDSTPDNLRATIIYTADSLPGGGIQNANARPPFAKAVATFKNFAFYGNTRTKQTLQSTLIAAGSPDGIQIADTITYTIAGGATFTITGAAAEVAASGIFKVETALTPAENIEITAQSIVRVLNTYASNTFLAAYYISGFDELPGKMLLERLTLDATAFYITCSRATPFRPVLPTTGSNYNNTSRNEENVNRIYYSKLQQPEAVPILQYFNIGSPEEPIEAIVPLRDGVIVLKTDGIFRISGSDVNTFSVNPIDTTVRILAKFSVAVLSNRVYFFSTQGIVAVSDTGAEIVSSQIESQILELSSALYPNFSNVTFAVGYESDRKYILWTVSTDADAFGTQAFVFNTLTGDWTRWTKSASAALVKQDNDRLYIAGPAANTADNYIFQERKNFNLTDFADEQYDLTLVSALGTYLEVNSTVGLEVGYTIQQTLASSRIVSIDSATELTMSSVADWVFDEVSAAIAYRPIYQYFETNNFDAGDPSLVKHWADCSFVFRETNFDTMSAGFLSDFSTETRTVTLTAPSGAGGWGTFPWGANPWGVSTAVRARLRTSVPKMAMRSNWLSISGTLNEAFTDLQLAGIALTFSAMSSRQKSSSSQ